MSDGGGAFVFLNSKKNLACRSVKEKGDNMAQREVKRNIYCRTGCTPDFSNNFQKKTKNGICLNGSTTNVTLPTLRDNVAFVVMGFTIT